MPRKPLGTYVRTTADWFLNESVTGGFNFAGGAGTQHYSISLFNQDAHGRIVLLDGVDIFAPGTITIAYQAFGVDGAITQSPQPIVSGNPLPTGLIYSYSAPSSAPPLQNTNRPALMFNFPAGQLNPIPVRARGPLAMLKPGYSYAVSPLFAITGPFTVNFYYSVISS